MLYYKVYENVVLRNTNIFFEDLGLVLGVGSARAPCVVCAVIQTYVFRVWFLRF